MKKYLLFVFTIIIFHSCMEDVEIPSGNRNGKAPSVVTLDPENIDFYSVTLIGDIESENGHNTIEKGFVFDSIENPVDTFLVSTSGGKGKFNRNITGLKPGKKYYYKAFARNDKGISYGDLIHFITHNDIPTVLSVFPLPKDIVDGTAICGGSIISPGKSPITQLGICWGPNEMPTIQDDSVEYYSDITAKNFSIKLERIRGGQRCHFRAFAINDNGTGYGDTISFATPEIWEKLPDFTGGKRDLAATFTLNNDFFIVGGGSPNNQPLKDTYVFSDLDYSWKQRSDIPDGKKGPVGFAIDDVGYVGFGLETGATFSNSMYRYNSGNNEWNELKKRTTDGITSRGYSASFTSGKYGYIVGGQGGSTSFPTTYSEVWKFHIEDDSIYWERCNDFKGGAYYNLISFTVNERIFVGFGFGSGTSRNTTIWEYDAENDGWSDFTSCPSDFKFGESGKGVSAITINDSLVYIIAGKQMWKLNIETKKWTAKSVMPGIYGGSIIFSSDKGASSDKEIYVGIDINSPSFYKYLPLWDN